MIDKEAASTQMAEELELAAHPDDEFQEEDGDHEVQKLKEKTRKKKGRGFGKGEWIIDSGD